MAPKTRTVIAAPGTGNLLKHSDIPDLVEAFGWSSNTVATEPQYQIWREHPDADVIAYHDASHQSSVPGKGASVGFLVSHGYAISWGNPLCPAKDYERVARSWIAFVQDSGLKPVFACVDKAFQEILSDRLEWTAVSCVKEDIIDPQESADSHTLDKRVRTKLNKAQKKGLVIWEEAHKLPDEKWKVQVERGCNEWSANRKGHQIHVTDLQPWRDASHRRYFYGKAPSEDGNTEELVGLLVLAKAKNAWVVKWLLEFPNAPKGTSESLVMHVLGVLKGEGAHALSFGVSGTDLEPVAHIKGWKIKSLAATYNGISHTFSLGKKSDFRSKFHSHDERMYICYPQDGLGLKGIDAIVDALKDDTNEARAEGEGGQSMQANPAAAKAAAAEAAREDQEAEAKPSRPGFLKRATTRERITSLSSEEESSDEDHRHALNGTNGTSTPDANSGVNGH